MRAAGQEGPACAETTCSMVQSTHAACSAGQADEQIVCNDGFDEVSTMGEVEIGVPEAATRCGRPRAALAQRSSGLFSGSRLISPCYADHTELVPRHVRVPAHVDHRVHPAGKLHQDSRRVLDGDAITPRSTTGRWRALGGKASRRENSWRRYDARQCRRAGRRRKALDRPATPRPAISNQLWQLASASNQAADRALGNELARPGSTSGRGGGNTRRRKNTPNYGPRRPSVRPRQVHRHRLLAEHVLAPRAEPLWRRLHGTRRATRCKQHRRPGRQRLPRRSPTTRAGISRCFGGAACDEAVKLAARFSLYRGDDALVRDVSNAGDNPVDSVHGLDQISLGQNKLRQWQGRKKAAPL